MRQLGQIVNDAALSTEEFREVRKAVIEAQYVNLAARQVLPIRKVSIGRQEYGFDTLSDLGTADVIAKATNFPGMDVNKARTLKPVLKHGVSFSIAREDLLSSREYGEPLNTVMARRASRLTQNKENDTAILQNALYGVNGLYNGAGKTEAGATWGTVANIMIDVLDAWDELDDQFEPTDLLVNQAQYLKLFQREASTDMTQYERILKLGITPRRDRSIAAGTALLMQSGADIAELIVAEDLDVEEDYVLANQSYKFNTFLRSVPAIYEPNALCTITGIA